MSYTLEFWLMDGAGEQDPDDSFHFKTKDDMIRFLSHVIELGSVWKGSKIEHMAIINDATNNHMI